jgi:hypothetical protein
VKIPNQVSDKIVRTLNVLVGISVPGENARENVVQLNDIDVYGVHIMVVNLMIIIVYRLKMTNQLQLKYVAKIFIVQIGLLECGLTYVKFNVNIVERISIYI